ncbi:MAG: DUF1844 domain-containing protein [Proteobacteria bacterium]|nr:MAG: DUF1844 domain-containing protein [Pseudomonadota bacterium]
MNDKMDLSTFFLSVASSAYMGLGMVDPDSGMKPEINLDLARQNIDLLELLFEKTHGNRTPDEERLIEHLLYEVRMKYVEVKKRNS